MKTVYTYLINPGSVLKYRREHPEADCDKDSDRKTVKSDLKNESAEELDPNCRAEKSVDAADHSTDSSCERRHSIISE